MARANKILSNIVGLAAARETCQGYLVGETDERTGEVIVASNPPIDESWKKYEPNTYADTGATITTTAPNPINPTRQRRKGVVTDLEASIGFNHDLSANNMKDMFEAALFSDTEESYSLPSSSVSNGAGPTSTITFGSETTFDVNDIVVLSGFPENRNKGCFRVTAVSDSSPWTITVSTLDSKSPNLTNTPTGAGVGQVSLAGRRFTVSSNGSGLAGSSITLPDYINKGDWVFVGSDENAFDGKKLNGFKRISEKSATLISFDKGSITGTSETSKPIDIFYGNSLTNGAIRPSNTFQFERSLGESSPGDPTTEQSELITGCVLNEVSVNFPASGLVNVDLGFISKDQQLLPTAEQPANKAYGAGGIATGTPPSDELLKGDIFNTTSDISRMNLSLVNADGSITGNEGFFNFVTEASLTINNGVTPDKALSVLGSFDYSVGNFIVSGSLQAYFANVEAVRAVRENSDVTLDYALVKENAGILFDLPLITLGDGRLNVEEGQSISLPLNTEAATAVKHGLDYTLKIVFFPCLPDLADEM